MLLQVPLERFPMRWKRSRFHLIGNARTGDAGLNGHIPSGRFRPDGMCSRMPRKSGDAQTMVKTVLYAEKLYENDSVERDVFGPDVRVVWRNVTDLSQLEERDCADVDGLMVLRHAVTAEHLAKFPGL